MKMEYTPYLHVILLVILSLDCPCISADDNRLLSLGTPNEYLNICMDGISHKRTPGPESQLFDKCSPWKNRSCCTNEIAEAMHVNDTWYKMDWSHCPTKPMSDKCRGRFIQDLCFYECSPNVGPWLVKVDGMEIRKERFVDVPLCQQECDGWWEDCKDDYTCIENWSRSFDWSTGEPNCPHGSSCKTFTDMYTNSTNFCEKVWDHSWKVVANDNPDGCFVMWWNTGADNPNYNIAKQRANQLVSAASTITSLTLWLSSLAIFSSVSFYLQFNIGS